MNAHRLAPKVKAPFVNGIERAKHCGAFDTPRDVFCSRQPINSDTTVRLFADARARAAISLPLPSLTMPEGSTCVQNSSSSLSSSSSAAVNVDRAQIPDAVVLVHNGRPVRVNGVKDDTWAADSANPFVHDTDRYAKSCSLESGSFGNVWKVMWMGGAPPAAAGLRRRKYYAMKATPTAETFRQRWRNNDEREREQQRALAECDVMCRLASETTRHPNICYATHVWTERMPHFASYRHACMLFERRPTDLFTFMEKHKAKQAKRRRYLAQRTSESARVDCARKGLGIVHAGHVLAQIVDALRFLHERFALVHNDVKPENVLYDPATRQCWLADFGGTSAPCNERDGYDNRTATPWFASPERRACLPFDCRSDSWAIGVTAIEVVFGGKGIERWFRPAEWVTLMDQVVSPPTTRRHSPNGGIKRRRLVEPMDERFLDCIFPQSSFGDDDDDDDCDKTFDDRDRNRNADLRTLVQHSIQLLPTNRHDAATLLHTCATFLQRS